MISNERGKIVIKPSVDYREWKETMIFQLIMQVNEDVFKQIVKCFDVLDETFVDNVRQDRLNFIR